MSDDARTPASPEDENTSDETVQPADEQPAAASPGTDSNESERSPAELSERVTQQSDSTQTDSPQGGDATDPSAEPDYFSSAIEKPGPNAVTNWEEGDDDPAAEESAKGETARPSSDSGSPEETAYNTDNVPTPPPPFPFEETGTDDSDTIVREKNLITDADPAEKTTGSSQEEADEDEEAPVTLMEHLDELRFRLVRCVIGVIVGCLGCYAFSKQLFDWLVAPLVAVMPESSTLIYTGLPEAFFTYIKVSLVAGAFAVSPYLFYQIWAFVSPGLYDEEKKYIIPIALISAIFFTGGAGFAYYVVFPFAFDFFMSFNTGNIVALPSLKEYLGFAIKLLFAFGLIFELPLFSFFLSRMGIVTANMMRNFRKYAVICSFIVSALLTPPDVISQLLMAGPLLVLFEISIVVAALFGKKKTLVESAFGSDDEDEPEEQATS